MATGRCGGCKIRPEEKWLGSFNRGAGRRAALSRLLLALGLLAAAAGGAHAAAFSRADTNHDGYATYPEAVQVFNTLPEVFFNKFDKDHDGRLNQSDWQALSNFYMLVRQESN